MTEFTNNSDFFIENISKQRHIISLTKRSKMFKFEALKSVNNPKSVHGMYPYRGKISSLDAQKIVTQFNNNSTLLDPFCGSGTILYEGAKHGLNVIGFDMNPIAVTIAEGKLDIPQDKNEMLAAANFFIDKAKKIEAEKKLCTKAQYYFHEQTGKQIACLANLYGDFPPYLKSCFMGAVCLAARGCNHYMWTSSSVGKNIEPKMYIDFYQCFIRKLEKHFYPLVNNISKVYYSDARKISEVLPKNSIDYIFTSPPYFDCLDYTAYYAKIIYEIFEIERDVIRNSLIQKYSTYEDNIKQVLDQLYMVCKPGAKVIFVVGDKKIHGKVINGADFFNKLTPFKLLEVVERNYTNSTSKIFDEINKTDRREQIIVWEK
jgi:16S rRNA G966 N2-methylase RsmD